jgi:O-antigen/teichoic acid export membrane protein
MNSGEHDRLTRAADLSVVSRVLRNGAGIMAARLVATFAAIAIVPFIIDAVGLQGFGVWETIFALASLTTAVFAALGTTFIWRISQALVRDTADEAARLIGVGSFLVLSAAAVVSLLAFTVYRAVPDPQNSVLLEGRNIAPYLLAVTAFGGVNLIRGAGLQAAQKAGLVALIHSAGQILNYVVALWLLLRGIGLWSLLLGVIVAQVFVYIVQSIALYQTFRHVCVLPRRPATEELRPIFRYFGTLMVGTVASMLRGNFDRLVLAAIASPAWVGLYGIAARVAAPIMEISNIVYVPVMAAAGRLDPSSDSATLQHLYSRMMAGLAAVVGLASLLLIALQHPIQMLWLGAYDSTVHQIVIWLVVGQATAVVLTGPGTAILKGLGRLRLETTYILVNIALKIVFTVLFIYLFGAIGTAIATGVSWAAASIWFSSRLHRQTAMPISATILGLLSLCLLAAMSWVDIFTAGACASTSRCLGEMLLFGTGQAVVFATALLLGAWLIRRLVIIGET